MESNISKTLEYADRLSVIENQKEILLRQFEENSILYFRGHQITANATMISHVKSYIEMGRQVITVLDDFKTPVGVGNPEEFLMKLSTTYQEALQKYEHAYNKLIKQRGDLDA